MTNQPTYDPLVLPSRRPDGICADCDDRPLDDWPHFDHSICGACAEKRRRSLEQLFQEAIESRRLDRITAEATK